MNKIFKVIWNHSAQRWVVASELSKAQGKTNSEQSASEIKSISGARFAFTAVMSGMLIATGQVANAVTGTEKDAGSIVDHTCFFDTATQSVVCGDGTTTIQDVYGAGTASNPTRISRSVALGKGAKVNNSFVRANSTDTEMNTDSVAIGTNATVNGYQSVAIGGNSQANERRAAAIGYAAKASALYSTAMGYGAEAIRMHSTAFGSESVIKDKATSDVARSNAILASDNANGLITEEGKAISASDSIAALAFGRQATAAGYAAMAQGLNAQATAAFSTAIGANSVADKMETIAVGSRAKATGHRAIAIGTAFKEAEATVASGSEAVAFGYKA